MDFEGIVRRILSEFKGLDYEELINLIEEKKKEAKGYLTDEGAARIVASELGVKIQYPERNSYIEIDDLILGLDDVTFTGRVLAVYPPKNFERKDGTKGRYSRLEVGDWKGVIPVIIWNDKVELVSEKKISRGDIIKILHGYVRLGLRSRPEVHLGFKGDMEVLPKELFDDRYPPLEHFNLRINEIDGTESKVNLRGFVHKIFEIHEFERRDGARGKVRRIQLGDETGELTVVLWDEKVDELNSLKIGDLIEIVNGKARRIDGGSVELHVGANSIVNRLGNYLEMENPTIRDIIANVCLDRRVNVLGKIFHIDKVREFERRDGSKGKILKIFIGDETGTLQLNLWNEKTEYAKNLKAGNVILVKKAYISERYGRLNLNLDGSGDLLVNPELEETERLKKVKLKIKKIGEITERDCLITVEGRLVSSPEISEVKTAEGEIPVSIIEIMDETGSIMFKAWREYAYKVKKLEKGSKVKLVNALVKRGYSDNLELTNIDSTEIEQID